MKCKSQLYQDWHRVDAARGLPGTGVPPHPRAQGQPAAHHSTVGLPFRVVSIKYIASKTLLKQVFYCLCRGGTYNLKKKEKLVVLQQSVAAQQWSLLNHHHHPLRLFTPFLLAYLRVIDWQSGVDPTYFPVSFWTPTFASYLAYRYKKGKLYKSEPDHSWVVGKLSVASACHKNYLVRKFSVFLSFFFFTASRKTCSTWRRSSSSPSSREPRRCWANFQV